MRGQAPGNCSSSMRTPPDAAPAEQRCLHHRMNELTPDRVFYFRALPTSQPPRCKDDKSMTMGRSVVFAQSSDLQPGGRREAQRDPVDLVCGDVVLGFLFVAGVCDVRGGGDHAGCADFAAAGSRRLALGHSHDCNRVRCSASHQAGCGCNESVWRAVRDRAGHDGQHTEGSVRCRSRGQLPIGVEIPSLNPSRSLNWNIR